MKKDLLHEYEKEHLFRAFRNKQVRIHADLLKNPFAPIIVHAKYDINYNRNEQKLKLTDQGFI